MHKYLLIGIIALAFLLRLPGLSDLPTGFTPDEASFGFDAYSLLETGRDQWGSPWPLVFKSFGDYKMPLYGYLAMPTIAIFGLNEVAVRLPGAILGSIAVLSTYFLTLKLFSKERRGRSIALLAALLLSLSPWHVQLSRGAFEANLTTFLLTSGILFFFKGLKHPKYFVLAAILLGLNLFSYHSARLLTPLIGLFLLLAYVKRVKYKNAFTFTAAAVAILFITLAAYTYALGAGARAGSSSIFGTAEQSGVDRYYAVKRGLPANLALLVFNKPLFLTEKLITNYISYFSPQFLFTQGPAEYTYGMLPGIGVLYPFEFVFLGFFLLYLFRKRLNREIALLLFWILVSPVPAALAVGPGSAANRVAILMPAIQIASALGGVYFYDHVLKLNQTFKPRFRLKQKQYLFAFSLLCVVCLLSFLVKYVFLEPAKGATAMIYGAREIFSNITDTGEVIVTKKISEPHIYLAFYKKINPLEYQEATKGWDMQKEKVAWIDQLPKYSLSNVTFKGLDLNTDARSGVVIVGVPGEFDTLKLLPKKVITYPSGTSAYMIMHIP